MVIPFVFTLSAESEHRYLWIFYKYAMLAKKEEMPIIAMENYFINPERYKEERCIEVCNKGFIESLEYEVPTQQDLEELKQYKISNKFTESLIKDKGSRSDAWVNLLKYRNEKFEQYIKEIFDKIPKEYNQPIDALLTFCHIPSLSVVAEELGIKIIHNEIGPLRNEVYRKTAYFDFTGLQANSELEKRYNNFIANRQYEEIRLLERKEILALMLEPMYINNIHYFDSEPQFEMGISTQYGYDYFLLAQGYNSNLDLILDCNKEFFEKNSLLRVHPGDTSNSKYCHMNTDNSENSMEFILKCKRIATICSNVCFEAMLWGKTAYSTQKGAYSFKSLQTLQDKREYITEIEFVNFTIFAYLIPYELMTDMEYIKWRLNSPSEVEIYNKHLEYYLKCRGIYEKFLCAPKEKRLYTLLKAQNFDNFGELKKREIDKIVMVNDISKGDKISEVDYKQRIKELEEGIKWHQRNDQEREKYFSNLQREAEIRVERIEELEEGIKWHQRNDQEKGKYFNNLQREVDIRIERIEELEQGIKWHQDNTEKQQEYIEQLQEAINTRVTRIEELEEGINWYEKFEEEQESYVEILLEKQQSLENTNNQLRRQLFEIENSLVGKLSKVIKTKR